MSAAAPRSPRTPFDPSRYEDDLVAILRDVADAGDLTPRDWLQILKRHPKDGRGFFTKSEVLAGLRALRGAGDLPLDESELVERLMTRPVRSSSGVTPVTVLTKPFPCPGHCVFCPNDVRMPKSYLRDEPGAQRAEDNGFDPYRQTWNRLAALRETGHPVEKVELIVLGGTWSYHPEAYQIWFVGRCFDALSDFGHGVDGRAAPVRPAPRALEGGPGGRPPTGESYNQAVSRALGTHAVAAIESSAWPALEDAHVRNEDAPVRCVGLAVETRPDCVDEAEVLRLRRLGCTKIQLGVQSLSDAVLDKNRRGHDVAATRRAFRLLRGAGFKLHVHWMPNLLGSTPEDDVRDFDRLFADPDFRPDELKIYPCSLVRSADLVEHYERGEWRPYSRSELVSVLADCMAAAPRYTRLTRVIREFSSAEIVDGSRESNLREFVERQLRERGVACRDIRSREIRRAVFDPDDLELRETRYESSSGREVFLEFTTPDDRIAGFLRLTLPEAPALQLELRGSALLREVHVYGPSLELGRRPVGKAQHAGLGRRLIERATQIAREAGYEQLSVISAIGTRPYYRRLGFRDTPLYQHLPT